MGVNRPRAAWRRRRWLARSIQVTIAMRRWSRVAQGSGSGRSSAGVRRTTPWRGCRRRHRPGPSSRPWRGGAGRRRTLGTGTGGSFLLLAAGHLNSLWSTTAFAPTCSGTPSDPSAPGTAACLQLVHLCERGRVVTQGGREELPAASVARWSRLTNGVLDTWQDCARAPGRPGVRHPAHVLRKGRFMRQDGHAGTGR